MTADLDTRLMAALADAASTTTVDDNAFEAVIARAGGRRRHGHPARLIATAGFGVALAITATVVAVTTSRGSSRPTLTAVQMPRLGDTTNNCGTVDYRPATAAETARVARLPSVLPVGYQLVDTPNVSVQRRAASSTPCWSAEVTYLDDAGRLITAGVQRQGDDRQEGCVVPEDYLPAECLTIGDRHAALTNEGTRATISWVASDEATVHVSGFGLSRGELIGVATSLTFDGDTVSVTPPAGMVQVEEAPRTDTDDRDVTYYTATFTNGDPAADIALTATTWDDISINEAGHATAVEIDGVIAVVVTTGGPGTGIIGWTYDRSDHGPLDTVSFDLPAHAYLTWNRDGVTYRIEGPDATTVIDIARQLEPA